MYNLPIDSEVTGQRENTCFAGMEPWQADRLQSAMWDCLNNSFSPSDFPSWITEQLSRYRQLILLEFTTPPLSKESRKFHAEVCRDLKTAVNILRLSPTGAILFLDEGAEDGASLAVKLYRIAAKIFQPDCYLSVSRKFSGIPQMREAYRLAEKRLEARFWDPKIHIFSYDRENVLCDRSSDPNDNTVIAAVKNALSARDALALQKQLDLLFQKYRNSAEQSQIFVKFVFSSVAMAMYPYLPSNADGEYAFFPPPETMITELYLQPDILKVIAFIQEMAQGIIQSFSSPDRAVRKEVLSVQEYIKKHYPEDLSLETLSSLVYLTPDYLSRLFKRDTGKSLSQYTRQVRMEKAIELLYTTSRKVVDISVDVGYSNYSYFCQCFREYFGKSPERYRQEEFREV